MTRRVAVAQPFWVLRGLVVLMGLVLAGRVIQIQVFEHEHHSQVAQVTWTKEIPLNPERGNIYDRRGNPLALSVTTWKVGVATSLLKDPAATAGQLAGILGGDAGPLESRLAKGRGRHLVLASDVVLDRQQKQTLLGNPAVTLEDQRSRVYPFDGVGSSLVGFYRHGAQDQTATGLEFSLAEYLAGRPGRARQIKTPQQNHNLGQVVLEEPIHGKHLVLSLDQQLQAICEERLQDAVGRCRAAGGSVLILDPSTGDILAAASWPLLPTRKGSQTDPGVWNNRNFTAQYEPGSVFKIFTTASLLRNCAIDTATVFDCNNPDFGKFTINNDGKHRYGDLNLMKAFSKSSNIYFARAVGNLSDEEFYRDLLDFGFGELTALPYRGQVKGILRPPSQWSGRSKPTLAIGQEVAVTPLQLGLALCSVANGGILYAPRLIREIRDPGDGSVQTLPPVPLRRVMTEPLTEVLREAMGRVVAEGTGVAARLDWITTGGKTGTAQKSKDGRTMAEGAYVATFAGLAPLDRPRLAILTVLDEPHGIFHFAAQSAVPLFREIVLDIRNRTDWLTDAPGAQTAALPQADRDRLATVPDVLYLSVHNAVQRIAAAELELAGGEREGHVVQQIPTAGTRCPPGTTVHLTVAAGAGDHAAPGALCPDFIGLSDRQIRSLAARLGVPVALEGSGYAARQDVPPGEHLRGNAVRIRMEGMWR